MDTTTAAAKASVTTATIRVWCRRGVVAAAKAAGRWVIEAASLARRIALGGKTKAIEYTIETMTAIGGNRWTRNGHDRVYLNDWADFAGIETHHYKTGNISSAYYQGEAISNSQAGKLLGCIDKVWFDTADGQIHCRFGWTESRVADRDEVWASVVSGVRAAIAAL